jgi:hypothetical protein
MCFGWRGKIRIRVVGLNYTGDVGASVYFSNLTNQTFRARIYLKELDKAVCKIGKLLYNGDRMALKTRREILVLS